MSKGYNRTSKINPCPICDDISGKCRSKDNAFFCMTEMDASLGSIINGFKCVNWTLDKEEKCFATDKREVDFCLTSFNVKRSGEKFMH